MTHFFSIGGHGVVLSFADNQKNSIELVGSMRPFEVADSEHCPPIILRVTVDDDLHSLPTSEQTLVRDFDTGNGMTRVDRMPDGQYQYICRNLDGMPCSLIIANADFSEVKCALRGNRPRRTFGLTNAIMLAYAYRASYFSTLLIHASSIRHNNIAYAFTAKSGTGKSTHVAQWLQNIEHCDMINDDNPIIRVEEEGAFLYGSPWSGKTPCYRPVRVRLGTIAKICRASENSCVELHPLQALPMLIEGCSCMRWEQDLSDNFYSTLSKIMKNRPLYAVNCLPNADAAITACRTLSERFE